MGQLTLTKMAKRNSMLRLALLMISVFSCPAMATSALAQVRADDEEFGPVVRAYLGYLRNEQEVVDDRVSRREISRAYYRRNSNRIRALRDMAIRIARESNNDYLPELEAVAGDELGTLFEHPPGAAELHIGEVLNNTFKFLGSVRSGEVFYIFARLDPYEQIERRKSVEPGSRGPEKSSNNTPKAEPPLTRRRRVLNP